LPQLWPQLWLLSLADRHAALAVKLQLLLQPWPPVRVDRLNSSVPHALRLPLWPAVHDRQHQLWLAASRHADDRLCD